jgi:hypothetical protein
MTIADDVKRSSDGLNAFKASFRSSFKTLLLTLGNNPSGFSSSLEAFIRKVETDLETIITSLNKSSTQLSPMQGAPTGTTGGVTASNLENFIKIANYLDDQGAYDVADYVTHLARMFKETEPQMEEKEMQPISERSLSTRSCPDHCGVPTVRITDNIVQCVIDGKIYDYGTGFINYKGQRVPGGNVSAQTPSQSDTGGIQMRTYEPTANILNRDN